MISHTASASWQRYNPRDIARRRRTLRQLLLLLQHVFDRAVPRLSILTRHAICPRLRAGPATRRARSRQAGRGDGDGVSWDWTRVALSPCCVSSWATKRTRLASSPHGEKSRGSVAAQRRKQQQAGGGSAYDGATNTNTKVTRAGQELPSRTGASGLTLWSSRGEVQPYENIDLIYHQLR
jgi:hypothetical protein